ncbi:DUF1294 domain-containing protein [Cerasicoccus maritimus]|uniref:DUF1294 domain-containing protein n=1 Tax=Cerasicoccus maritimus TaxID=490089 RepID=UPI002852D7FE|nr:DUF1294 domain-containing protein [Cerasicoccus maritimus]
MPRNRNPNSRRRPARYWLNTALVAIVVSVLPCAAAIKLSQAVRYPYLAGYLAIISIATILVYYLDKRKAQVGAWRIPESTLHLLELAGGWPAAYVAQRAFRHKTSKTAYQFTFWAIALLQNLVALDYLLNWRFTRGAVQFAQSLVA